MSGARNRRHGHASELMVCAWLRGHGYPDACTTRAALGHDGTKQPGDVIFRPDVLLEVKARASSSWPAWIAKAKGECRPGQRWIVVRRLRGVADVGKWPAVWGANGDGPAFRHDFADIVYMLGTEP